MSLSDDEKTTIKGLTGVLEKHDPRNSEKAFYYDGKKRLEDLGISIPDRLKGLGVVVGWPATGVDVLEERLELTSFGAPESFDLDSVFAQNSLDTEASLGHIDALHLGVGFVCVGKGDESVGEPAQLITVESPTRMTCSYNARTRRLDSALAVNRDKTSGNVLSGTLYLPDSNVQFERKGNGQLYETVRDDHNFHRVTVARLVNRPRSSDSDGRSEITRAIRYYTQAGMRTMLGAEVAREFYSAPQRYVIGAADGTFKDDDGNPVDGWKWIMGRLMDIPLNEDNDATTQMPTVGQFNANSPTPYFDQLRLLAQMVAAEYGIPAPYLGFVSDNPSSADAIRAAESRLVKRAERRQKQFGRAWAEAARLVMLFRDNKLPENAYDIHPAWMSAATPTKAASADAGQKAIAAGVVPADSEVAMDLFELTERQKVILREDARRKRAAGMAQSMGVAAQAALNDPAVRALVVNRGASAAAVPANVA